MKPLSKTIFCAFIIFALLFNDVVITARARSREKAFFGLLRAGPSSSEQKKVTTPNETNDGQLRLKSERNQIAIKADRAIKFDRAITSSKTRFIILLSIIAVGLVIAIGASIGKSYFNNKREKEDEVFKKQVLTAKVEQQLEKETQNELFLEYCQLFQSLGKLVETNIIVGKFHAQETSTALEELKTKQSTNELISKASPILAGFSQAEKEFTLKTYENCFNAYHWRSEITDVGGISHDLKFSETDFAHVREVIISAKNQVKETVKTSPTDYLDLADLVSQGKEAYSTVTELTEKAKEKKLDEVNKYNPITIETPANTFIGDAQIGGQIAKGAWDLYKKIVELDEIKDTAEKENLGQARKGLSYITCGWEMLENLFKTLNTVVGMVSGSSLNVPFTGLVTLTLKLVSAISNYKVAYDQWSADKTDLKELTKDLKFWDMMDAICDLLQELANDMILISPLTAGVSAVLGIAIKVAFGLLGVFTAWMRLRKSRNIHEKIIAGLKTVTTNQQKNTKVMSEELTKRYCLTINEILRQYLQQEFKRFEAELVFRSNLAQLQYEKELNSVTRNGPAYLSKQADWNSEIESANLEVLKSLCAYSDDNCVTSFNGLVKHSITPFGNVGYIRHAKTLLESAVIGVRTGPINSALVVLQGTTKTPSIEFSLLSNGYVPAYQLSSSYKIFVCRSCLDTGKLVESLTFGNTDGHYSSDYVKAHPLIQDTIHVRNVANDVETVQFMNALLGDLDETKKNKDYAIVHGTNGPELKALTKTTAFDFYSLVIYAGKTLPDPAPFPVLGAISTSAKYYYLLGASSSTETDVKGQWCKTGCSIKIVRVDEGKAERVVENEHSSDVRVTTVEYNHRDHISEKGYLYAFSINSGDDAGYKSAGWEAINSEDVAFDGQNFKLYRKKIHDVSSILTTEYKIDPNNLWTGMQTLESSSSREILKLTKKVHCETCKTAFANTAYGNFEFNGFDPCSTSDAKWETDYKATVERRFNEQKCRGEKGLSTSEKTAKRALRKSYICGVASDFWTNTANLFVTGASTFICDSALTETCT